SPEPMVDRPEHRIFKHNAHRFVQPIARNAPVEDRTTPGHPHPALDHGCGITTCTKRLDEAIVALADLAQACDARVVESVTGSNWIGPIQQSGYRVPRLYIRCPDS